MPSNFWLTIIPIILTGILAYLGQHIIYRGKRLEVAAQEGENKYKFTSEKESRLWTRMELEISRLDKRIVELEANRDLLIQKNAVLTAKCDQFEALSKRVEDLELQNRDLKIYNYQLNRKVKELTSDKKALHEQLDRMQLQLKTMSEDHE